MKQKINIALCLAFFGVVLGFTMPGCSLLAPKSPVTWEASRYASFRDCWTITLAVYDANMDRRVAGKVSVADAQDIDRAWNLFRAAYRTALAEASGNELAFTPESVKKLANDVLTLIYASQ